MRTLKSLGFAVVSVLALSAVGCSDDATGYAGLRQSPSTKDGAPAAATQQADTVTVNGTTAAPDAATVDVLALGKNGELTPVTTAPVTDGKFTAAMNADTSPTGIFIMKVKDLGGSVINSGIVNGAPAFIKGFVIDAPVDALTSFKAEVLTTIAKGGVPGVQNYLNVLDVYVDAQLAGTIATVTVLATDANSIISATSDAVIAAENVITSTLQKAGIPVDLSVLQSAQASGVSGVEGYITSSNGELVKNSRNLVASLEAATAKAAAPVDQAIFNAVVNGGAAFGGTMKKKTTATPTVAFAAQKSAFSLESSLTTSSITTAFPQNDQYTKACTAFLSAVGGAASTGDLDTAKSALTNALLGKDDAKSNDILAQIKQAVDQLTQLGQTLSAAFATFDPDQISAALGKIDTSAMPLPAQLQSSLSGKDAAALTDALRLVQKQVAQ